MEWTVISRHQTAEDAFGAIYAWMERAAETGAPPDATDLVVLDGNNHVIPRPDERLAEAIAQGANEVFPPEVRTFAQRQYVCWTIQGRPGGGTCRSVDFSSGHLDVESARSAVAGVLERLQDVVTEIQTTPWPLLPDKPAGYFASSRIELREGHLRFWFEVDGDPVTRIAEVPLTL